MRQDELIRLLNLQKHPEEGGYFVETYRSPTRVPADVLLDPAYAGPRSIGTAIYYLITPDSFSAMPRVVGDEIFHHYLGDAVETLLLHPDGRDEVLRLGKNLSAGERPQVVVPGGVWQGSRLAPGSGADGFALLGTTMAPGFDYADYEHGRREALVARYPSQAERILLLRPS